MNLKRTITGMPAWVTEELARRGPKSGPQEQMTIISRGQRMPQQGIGEPIAAARPPAPAIDTIARSDNAPAPAMAGTDTIGRPKEIKVEELPYTGGTDTIAQPAMGSRNTGAGSDNIVQPDKVAGVAHEGERVLSAPASANIDDDTFVELTKQLENGTIDLNAIRTALKKQPLPGYAAGSGATPIEEDPLNPNPTPADGTTPITNAAAPASSPLATTPTETAPGRFDTIINTRLTDLQRTAAGENPNVQRQANRALRQFDTRAASQAQAVNQKLATQSWMPDSSREAAAAQEQSAIRSGRSELIGGLAEKNMQAAEAAGAEAATLAGTERSTARQNAQDALAALMKLGVTENMPAIIQKFKELGIPVNEQILGNADTQARVTKGMEIMATDQAAGLSQDQIIAHLRVAGVYDALNGAFGTQVTQWTGDIASSPVEAARSGTPSADQARWLVDNGYDIHGNPVAGGGIRSLLSGFQHKTNTIDEEWNSIASSEVFRGLPPDAQQRMRALFEFRLTGGDIPYNITKDTSGRWVVTPKTEEQINQEQTGAYTGDPWGTDAMTQLAADPTGTAGKSILNSIITDILTRHDFSKLNTLPAGSPARTAIDNEISNRAMVWDGATRMSKYDPYSGEGGFTSPPTKDQIIKYGGKTYIVTSDVSAFREGKNGAWNQQQFSAIDMATGRTIRVTSSANRVNIL